MNKTYLDRKGYLRFKRSNKPLHRWVAYHQIYKKGVFFRSFRSYQIHHIDGNKLNNDSSNLKLLTRSKHRRSHKIKHPLVKFLEWLFGK